MNKIEFMSQITRMDQQFGKYGEVRAEILYDNVKDMSLEWFKRVVSAKLATSRYAPLPADFLDDLAIERERVHQREKEQREKESKGIISDSDWGYGTNEQKKEWSNLIKKIMAGKSSADEVKSMHSLIKHDCETTAQRGEEKEISKPDKVGNL